MMKNIRMSKSELTLLSSLIYVVLYSSYVQADLKQQCMVGVPTFTRSYTSGDMNTMPVEITSSESTVNYPDSALFMGNVLISQGNRQIQADKVEFLQEDKNKNKRTVTALGNITYDDNLIKLTGTQAWADLDSKDADIINSVYHMVGRQGRGKADKIQLQNNRYITMDNASYTSCLEGDNSWRIVGSKIVQDNQEQVAEIWNARFQIGSVPVFYSPYLQIPTGNKRRSGFLLPSGSYSSSNGLQFALPYYWNIAPNFDATLTPNLISKRGLQLQNEFRYLTMPGEGLVQFDWLEKDRKYSDYNPNEDRSRRWLFHWQHFGIINQVWRPAVNMTKVSDNNYLKDIDTIYGSSTDSYLRHNYQLGYANQNWDATLQVKQFQVLTPYVSPYRAEPMFDMNYYHYGFGPINFHTYAQVAHFTNDNANMPQATRIHFEPIFSMPVANQWGSLNTEVKLLTTHYQQSIPSNFASTSNSQLDDDVTRFIPQYKINGQLVFERNTTDWLKNYKQTLEPRIQYLYTPTKKQSNIYNYDSTLLQLDYTGLFRDRQYSGLDRIASANQLSTGITTRFYDDKLSERFNLSAGQIYYFTQPSIGDDPLLLTKTDQDTNTVWATDGYLQINEKMMMRGGLQYDARLGHIALSDAVIEYRENSQKILQFSYRFASREYISATVTNLYANKKAYQRDLTQLGTVGSWPITDNWSAVGAYYYDPKNKQTVNGLVGLQYSTCCWGVGVSVERKIVDWNKNYDQKSNYDNKVSFNVELRGLSEFSVPETGRMLRSNVLPYQRSF